LTISDGNGSNNHQKHSIAGDGMLTTMKKIAKATFGNGNSK